MNDRYSSPLAERYASQAMLELWSPSIRHGLWRRLWLALAEAQKELGVPIPDAALDQMRANLDLIDFDAVRAYERRFRHDVMAHVHGFGDVAPAAKPFIHLGATSAFVTDNADLIIMRRGLDLLRGRILEILRALAAFSEKWASEPTLGYTHLQPAQLTTVGKRATLWMQDLVLDYQDLEYRRRTLPFRGVKGTTGTQASFLSIFGGDHAKVRALDDMVTAKMGFASALAVTGQTYTRKLDAAVLGVVSGIAATAAKFSGDIRMLQSFGEIEEPFESEQIGSSAMAYKRNPMRSERIAALSRFVMSLEPNANQTHAVQYFERTLDDSANRRLSIPESFLATDAILILMGNISAGLEVNVNRIRARIDEQLPFMATEELLVQAVAKGGDRQMAHETIRKHSMDAVHAMRESSGKNDLLDRLAKDKSLGLPASALKSAGDPSKYIGRAPEQVREFLAEVIQPIFAGETQGESTRTEEIRV
ncbi:MAG: adenylosuccinate lyase [Gemmatimonadaceae bacterium]|nr:adenylosuccinate lyase [Gemmatimonadaceae bacterium]